MSTVVPSPSSLLSAKDCGSCVEPSKKKACGSCPDSEEAWGARSKPIEPKPAPRDLPLVYESQEQRAKDARKVLTKLINTAKSVIPKELVEDAKAIAIFLRVKKVAVVFGGRWGKRSLTTRERISGLVLDFTNDGAARSLRRGKLTLNAEASAAHGPVVGKMQAGVEILMTSRLLSYSRSKGALRGVSVDGAMITIGDRNKAPFLEQANTENSISRCGPSRNAHLRSAHQRT